MEIRDAMKEMDDDGVKATVSGDHNGDGDGDRPSPSLSHLR